LLVDSVESMMMHGFANPKRKNNFSNFFTANEIQIYPVISF
jgi:hypothetical protein